MHPFFIDIILLIENTTIKYILFFKKLNTCKTNH
jgi:hypothetical protein